ncbi:hypothetical protein J3R30DRAFT_3588600 [Lentinula aciculospora]|uniref:Uncharacterized protein n=1 Tax=Lentinula aciculospora TaxID=153920 RepID=A0A9W8ZUY6_9AGAR|nr:hypothetical protein J3R30DRAFT_3588600 [Lentinula aciculospora]
MPAFRHLICSCSHIETLVDSFVVVCSLLIFYSKFFPASPFLVPSSLLIPASLLAAFKHVVFLPHRVMRNCLFLTCDLDSFVHDLYEPYEYEYDLI